MEGLMFSKIPNILNASFQGIILQAHTAQKVSVFVVILVQIF